MKLDELELSLLFDYYGELLTEKMCIRDSTGCDGDLHFPLQVLAAGVHKEL